MLPLASDASLGRSGLARSVVEDAIGLALALDFLEVSGTRAGLPRLSDRCALGVRVLLDNGNACFLCSSHHFF